MTFIPKFNPSSIPNSKYFSSSKFILPSECVISDFIDKNGNRVIKKIINDDAIMDVIKYKDGTQYYATSQDGKVIEMCETKPNGKDVFSLTSNPDGGYTESIQTNGLGSDSFNAIYDKDNKLVKLIENKFDVSKPFDEIDTSLILDNAGNLTERDTIGTLIDSCRDIGERVKNLSKEKQKVLQPMFDEAKSIVLKLIDYEG